MPLFSIITVCLNPGPDLDPTVRSVLAQDFEDYELIIKDGGSSDGTQKRTWADPRVRFISSPDKGIFDAMNHALGLATGEFVCFLNAGDFFPGGHVLSAMAGLIKGNPDADLFYGDVRKPQSRSGFELYPDRLSRFFLFTHSICHQCWFLRRSVYLSYDGFETAHTDVADCRLLLRLLVRGGVKYKHLPRIVVHYKGGGSSAGLDKQEKNQRWVDELRRELFSPLEYRAFHLAWKMMGLIKAMLYDHLPSCCWRMISSLRRRSQATLQQDDRVADGITAFQHVCSSACAGREKATEASARSSKPNLVIVSNGITPYGTHFLERVADEMPDFKLRTIYSYQFSMGQWEISPPPSINAVILGKGEVSTNQRGFAAMRDGWTLGRRLVREIQAHRPAAVMIMGYGYVAHYLAIEWCGRNRIPCMMFGDSNILGDNGKGIKAWVKRLVVSRAVSRCSALLPCGTLGAQYFQKYGARREQIFFAPYEPDYSLFEDANPMLVESLAAEFLLAPRRHRFIYCGRLVARKRVDLLIEGFAPVADQRPDWDLLIVGDGPLKAELKIRIPSRLEQRVLWVDFVGSPEKLAALYRLADVLVLPSDYEPWGVVVNEAACAGLALVCSDVVGAAAELLRDRRNGRSFRAGDVTSLVAALRDVTNEANLCRYRATSPQVLESWRKKADPVDGLRRALDFSLQRADAEELTNPARQQVLTKPGRVSR